MKINYKKVIFAIMLLIIGFHIGRFLKKEHNVSYNIDSYTIKEHFYQNKKHWYDFIITKKKHTYIISLDENLKKKKRVIQKIITYKEKDVVCILPIYTKTKTRNLYCNLDNKQVSLDYLIKTKNGDFKKIQSKIKKFKINYPQSQEKKKKYRKINVYNSNIDDKDTYVIWDYKGIYLLNSEENQYRKILNKDLYDNVMAELVDHFYILLENRSVKGIQTIYYYDIKKDKIKKWNPAIVLSKDSYINGTEKKFIFITDNKTKKEYMLNINKRQIKELDTGTTSYVTYDNYKEKNLSKSDFFAEKQYFKVSKIENYYYYQKDNKIYKYLESKEKKPILLFELDNIKEWNITKDEIIVLKDDTVYSYTDKNGLRKILENKELNYNYKNIYKVWRNK